LTGNKTNQLDIGAPGGEFWMLGKSTTSCISDTLHFKIVEEPDWQFEIDGDNSICEGDTVELKAENAVNYKWNTGDTTSLIRVSKEGKYTVTGLNLRGCEKQDEIFIKVNQIPSVEFTLEPKTITKDQNKIRVFIPQENSVEYYWNFGDGGIGTGSELYHEYNITGSINGLFTVKLIAVSKALCSDTISKIVVIYPTIPDIFTPDNDGFNDTWKVNLSEYFDNGISAAIFNRWGEKLIEWTNVRELSWDGRYKGVFVNPGVFVYVIKCETKSGEEVIFSGDVTVLR
jgi:gliding motility-associated-like protein